MRSTDPTLAEQVCLALVAEGPVHGWMIGTLLSPTGDLGRIWSLSRPLTYRAIDAVIDRGLVRRRGEEPGRGRNRTTLTATAKGQRSAATWLDQPVTHLREIRTELLIKLALRERAGLDLASLLDAQATKLAPTIDSLETIDSRDPVDLWRRENARAVTRFLRAARESDSGRSPPPPSEG